MYLSMPSLMLGGKKGSLSDCTQRYGTWNSGFGDRLILISSHHHYRTVRTISRLRNSDVGVDQDVMRLDSRAA